MTAQLPRDGRFALSPIHHFAHISWWLSILARTFSLVFLFTSISAAQSNEPKRVLLLMQEDLSWPLFQLIDQNVRATLRNGSPEGILIFSEHMDRIHFPDPKIQAQRAAWIQKKYANSKLNLVIAVGDVPEELFPGVPLIYLGANSQQPPAHLSSNKNAAGIWVHVDVRKTLDIARRFQPAARQVVIIGGSSSSEKTLLDQVREQMAEYTSQLQVVYLTGLSLAEISHKVATLGPESILLFVSLGRDGAHPYISSESISKITVVSKIPVYVLLDTHTGTGAVGGYVTRFAEMGKQAGEMALQVLAGGQPSELTTRSDYIFDSQQLRRWKIPESALPPGTIFINHQPTIWESYRWYILGAVLLFLAEAMLIFGLLWQRASRKKFERSLLRRMDFEKMLSDLSTTFINLPGEQVGRTIEQSFDRIANFLNLDRITLFEFSRTGAELVVTLSWRREEAQGVPAIIKADKLPWYTKRLASGETVLISHLEELPEEAAAEKEHLQKLNTISVATVPLSAGEEFFGCVSFATTRRAIDWTTERVEPLKLLAEIFSNALMRKRAQEARFQYAAIVESSDDAIISKNLNGRILTWNAGAQRLFGFSEAEVLGQGIAMLIPEERRDDEEMILRRLRAGEHIEHYETVRLTKSGKKIDVSLTISPVRDSSGVVVGACKIARDITERKRALQVLQESEDRFRLVANSAPVLIWMSDADKQCTFFNQNWLNFTGRSLSSELGDGWVSGVHPEDVEHCWRIYSTAFEARVDFEMEYRLRRYDGEYRWLVDFGAPRFEADSTFLGYIGSCVDITERKSSEEALHQLSGRLIRAQEEERSRIARELHDDFSQRLALLGIGLGQLWKKLPDMEAEERAKIMEMLKAIKEISADIHSLSHQLHSSKLEHVGLVPALMGLCREVSDKCQIDVRFMEREESLNLPKDVALCLFRVAQESLANVVKHSQATIAEVQLFASSNGVTLRVSDSGSGFENESHTPNAGIGLIGMSERLRLVGGTLSVNSEPGRGTEIRAEVPLTISGSEIPLKMQVAGA